MELDWLTDMDFISWSLLGIILIGVGGLVYVMIDPAPSGCNYVDKMFVSEEIAISYDVPGCEDGCLYMTFIDDQGYEQTEVFPEENNIQNKWKYGETVRLTVCSDGNRSKIINVD